MGIEWIAKFCFKSPGPFVKFYNFLNCPFHSIHIIGKVKKILNNIFALQNMEKWLHIGWKMRQNFRNRCFITYWNLRCRRLKNRLRIRRPPVRIGPGVPNIKSRWWYLGAIACFSFHPTGFGPSRLVERSEIPLNSRRGSNRALVAGISHLIIIGIGVQRADQKTTGNGIFKVPLPVLFEVRNAANMTVHAFFW